MKILPTSCWILGAAMTTIGFARQLHAQAIYKCPIAGGVEYTDRPCPGKNGELLHKPDDTEIIDHYLSLDQVELARRYAESHHLAPLFENRLAAHQQSMEQRNQKQLADADAVRLRDRQAELAAKERARADEQARLQAQNDLLREQNAQYQQQLNQPVSNDVPYYGVRAWPRPWEHRHDHDRDDAPSWPPEQPVFHPCTPIAGGTVKC